MHPGLGHRVHRPLVGAAAGAAAVDLVGAQDVVQGATEVAVDEELGVEHLADAPALTEHLHGHGVDQERPVVGDDLDHGRPARPPVVGLAGVRIAMVARADGRFMASS